MIHRIAALVALFLLASFVPLPAQQSAGAHSGFWLSGGLGVGVTDEESIGDDAGPAFYLRMGGTPSDRILLGGEVVGFTRDVGGADVTLGNATFSVFYYPAAPGGLYVKAGAGFASATVSTELAGGTFTSDDEGFGLTFGSGYDIKIGDNLYLTPNLDVMVQSFDEFADANSFLFTLGIGFH